MQSVSRYVVRKLKLAVNEAKSSVSRPWQVRYLGFRVNDWILRRLRAYVWTQWRLPRTKVRNLLVRGVHPNWARALGNTRKGPWRISKQSPVMAALPERYFTQKLGLVLLG